MAEGQPSENLSAHVRRRQGLGQEARKKWHSWAGSRLAVTAPAAPTQRGTIPAPTLHTAPGFSCPGCHPMLLPVPTLIPLISKGAHLVYFLVNT